MVTPRIFGISATLLPDGKVLIAGGAVASTSAGVTNTAHAELYDPSTGAFAATGDMIAAKACPSSVLLGNGKVLIAGGASWNEPAIAASAELYDPATGVFASAGPYANRNPRKEFGFDLCPVANLLPDGRALIVWDDLDATAEICDPGAGAFSLAGAKIRPGGLWSPATLLTNGKVLFTGGNDSDAVYADAEVYDPSSGVSTAAGAMTTPRGAHTATLLPDGTVLIAGSEGNAGGGGIALASAELYDPAKGAFTATGSMTAPRYGHTATLLSDGTVLIAGGMPGGAFGGFPGAEVYHPAVLVPAPALLSLSGDGKGPGAIQHASTYQVVSPSDPAVAGEALIVYCTGLADRSVIPPQVGIAGRMAEVLWFGKTPGYAGLNQVNVRVPSGIEPAGAVPVRLNYIGRPSNDVTIAVR
jgi:hypothetical protein